MVMIDLRAIPHRPAPDAASIAAAIGAPEEIWELRPIPVIDLP